MSLTVIPTSPNFPVLRITCINVTPSPLTCCTLHAVHLSTSKVSFSGSTQHRVASLLMTLVSMTGERTKNRKHAPFVGLFNAEIYMKKVEFVISFPIEILFFRGSIACCWAWWCLIILYKRGTLASVTSWLMKLRWDVIGTSWDSQLANCRRDSTAD